MPAKIFRWAVGVTAVSMILGMAAGAQVTATCKGMGSVGAVMYGGQSLKGAPYSNREGVTRSEACGWQCDSWFGYDPSGTRFGGTDDVADVSRLYVWCRWST